MGIFKTPKPAYVPPPVAAAQPAVPTAADATVQAKGQATRSGAMGGLASTLLTGARGLTDTANQAKKQLTGQ